MQFLKNYLNLNPACFFHTECVYAVQFFHVERRAGSAALLHRPAAFCAVGGEFTAILPAAHHEQVCL